VRGQTLGQRWEALGPDCEALGPRYAVWSQGSSSWVASVASAWRAPAL